MKRMELQSSWQGGAMYLFKGALAHQPFCSQEDPVVSEAQLAHHAAAQLREMCPYLVIHPGRG